jgi:starvation-inducible DNA-binding protein
MNQTKASSAHDAAEKHNSTTALVGKINQLVADGLALYLKTKNFHWHMNGPHFRDHHPILDDQASEILDIVDPLAERVRALGHPTVRSLGEVMRLRTVTDNDKASVTASAMLDELMQDNQTLVRSMREAHGLCDEGGDVATASLLENYIDAAEKRAWFLRETVAVS